MPITQNIPSQPLITFIVTTYNLPVDMLKECVDSILALSLSKEQREVIIIDDGSDVSPINDFANKLDDIIYLHQPNLGLSAARNMGLRIASGMFIQFVDGDDCLIQPEYEHCLDILRYNKPVDMITFYTADSKNQPVDFSYDGPMTGAQYMENNNICSSACGYIFRANRLGELRFTQGLLHEDEEFTPQLLLRIHNLYTTKAKAYYYRKRQGSITSSPENKDKRLDDTMKILMHLQAIASSIEDQDKKIALNRRVAQLTMDYLVNTIRLTRSRKRLNEAISILSKHELYPLPDKHYTRKYTLFNKMIRSNIGKIILMALL